MFQSFQTLKRKDVSKAKEAFKGGLERHIRWEEDLLLPLWEDKTGMSDGGATFVMRREHRQIEEHLQAIGRNVTQQNMDNNPAEQALARSPHRSIFLREAFSITGFGVIVRRVKSSG